MVAFLNQLLGMLCSRQARLEVENLLLHQRFTTPHASRSRLAAEPRPPVIGPALPDAICHVPQTYAAYCNELRTHLALAKDAPRLRRRQLVGKIATRPILGGLYHQYIRF